MKVAEVLQAKNADGEIDYESVKLNAVYGNTDENKEWSKWTPSAQFQIQINNPAAFNTLSKGHEYFVDFTPAS